MRELVPESYYPDPTSSPYPLCRGELEPSTHYYLSWHNKGCQFPEMHAWFNISPPQMTLNLEKLNLDKI